MNVTITARHGDIPDTLRERSEQIVERLERLSHRPTSAHVTFDNEGPKAFCEIVLNAARGAVHVAKASAVDHRTALDRAEAKLRRQLDKVEAPARTQRRKAASR
jgi:ribosomal subunit interface protein